MSDLDDFKRNPLQLFISTIFFWNFFYTIPFCDITFSPLKDDLKFREACHKTFRDNSTENTFTKFDFLPQKHSEEALKCLFFNKSICGKMSNTFFLSLSHPLTTKWSIRNRIFNIPLSRRFTAFWDTSRKKSQLHNLDVTAQKKGADDFKVIHSLN